MTNQINIDGKIIPEPTEYTKPIFSLIITTYELAEEPAGHYFWKPTVTHSFHGETIDRLYQLSNAHKETDAFYKASFEGKLPWKGGNIILKNSEFQVIKE